MTQLCQVGFFQEMFADSEIRPSLRAFVADTPQPDESKIIAYLKSGVGFSARAEYVSDVLDPSSKPGLLAHLVTDGKYLWRTDLAYYVAKYHVRLQDEFVAYMRSNHWTVPDESQIDVDNLTAE